MGSCAPEDIAARDKYFTEVWFRCKGSVKAVTNELGISARAVMSRRNDVARRTGADLPTTDGRLSARKQFEDDITSRYGGFQLQVRTGSVIVGSDVHSCDYVPTAMRGFAAACRALRPVAAIINGDDVDLPTAGRWPRASWGRQMTVADSLAFAQRDLALVEETHIPGMKLIRTLGNHDARFEAYLANHAEAFEGVPGMTLQDHFPLWQNCVATYINGTQVIVKHRWHNGVHAVYNNVLKGGTTIVTGHTHSQKVTPYTNFAGTNYGVDCGMMADPSGEQFAYGEHNPYNHRSGFAVLTFIDGELMPPELATVVEEGRMWFRGKVWQV